MEFFLTDAAKEAFAKGKQKSDSDIALRLKVIGLSCCGPRLGAVLDEPKSEDYRIDADGIPIVMEKDLVEHVRGKIKIDYIDSWLRQEFMVSGLGGNSSNSCSR